MNPSRVLGVLGWLAAVVCLAGMQPAVSAQETPKGERVAVGKVVTPTGSIIARKPGATKFDVIKQGESVYSGDLLVALPGAVIESKNGMVQLSMHADLDHLSPYPILECAVVLHSNPKADLDFTLDRGRVDVLDNRADGSCHIVVRFWNQKWEWDTGEKKTRVALELYGRWPRGVFFDKEDNKRSPVGGLVMVVLYGEVSFMHDGQVVRMHAPPGPAEFHWDSVGGADATPMRLEKLPAWADPETQPSAEAKKRRAVIEQMRQTYAREGVDGAILKALESGDSTFRRVGVVCMGATDDLPRLIDALGSAEFSDLRDTSVRVLRHWIGRGPGQDQKLFNALQKRGYSPVHAELVMMGLHTPGPTELARPELYEALIAYLDHDKLAIRELADWHLDRLFPEQSDKIKYDPVGTKAEREAAIKKWKEFIPEGKLPPKPKDVKEFRN